MERVEELNKAVHNSTPTTHSKQQQLCLREHSKLLGTGASRGLQFSLTPPRLKLILFNSAISTPTSSSLQQPRYTQDLWKMGLVPSSLTHCPAEGLPAVGFDSSLKPQELFCAAGQGKGHSGPAPAPPEPTQPHPSSNSSCRAPVTACSCRNRPRRIRQFQTVWLLFLIHAVFLGYR